MISCGLDVGSRTTKLVLFDGEIRSFAVVETGVNPLRRCQALLAGRKYDLLTVTGYGRHLVGSSFPSQLVSEITAHALGARFFCLDCRTVIDVGGQDSKVIALSSSGDVQKFEMNDRCAAGTGRFLEVMAGTLEVGIDRLGELAATSQRTVQINSQCTVFAESEVVSLVGRGEEPSVIAISVLESISTRIFGMARRVGVTDKVVFTGGTALNRELARILGEKLERQLLIPENPQIAGALGAAIYGAKT